MCAFDNKYESFLCRIILPFPPSHSLPPSLPHSLFLPLPLPLPHHLFYDQSLTLKFILNN